MAIADVTIPDTHVPYSVISADMVREAEGAMMAAGVSSYLRTASSESPTRMSRSVISLRWRLAYRVPSLVVDRSGLCLAYRQRQALERSLNRFRRSLVL